MAIYSNYFGMEHKANEHEVHIDLKDIPGNPNKGLNFSYYFLNGVTYLMYIAPSGDLVKMK